MNKFSIGLIVLLIIGAGTFFLSSNSDSNITGNTISENPGNGNAKTFILTGENFKFVLDGVSNPDIRVKQGDLVRIEFTSTQGFHDWVVVEFRAATRQVVSTDGATFVEFVANQKGTFEYYCSVGQHRTLGMKGNLIVE